MKQTLDMTEGTIWKKILAYSIPLLLGNFAQLLYSTVDSIVVGQFEGRNALSAVGASGPIINVLVGLFMGVSSGASVYIANRYGAKDDENVSKGVHTYLVFSFFFGLVFMILGYFFSRNILQMIDTPAAILDDSTTYLQIYFLGVVFTVFYNAGTAILQAIGDSKRPLIFLAVCSVINTILDIWFVASFGWGVAGVAWATLIATAISVVLIFITLLKDKSAIHLMFDKLKMDLPILSRILKIGIPAGLQSIIVSGSNVIVQKYLNVFGEASIAAYTSVNKIDSYMGLPANSFALAVTTFVSQNMGAKKYDRVKQGIRQTLWISVGSIIAISICIVVFSAQVVEIFIQDAEVISIGQIMIYTMSPFYGFLSVHTVLQGVLRAFNRSVYPMLVAVVCFVVIRQIFLFFALDIVHSVYFITLSFGLTWTLACIGTSWMYRHFIKIDLKAAQAY